MEICQGAGILFRDLKGWGGGLVISYEPLWRTMEQQGATTYTLQVKGQISSSTIRRLKTGQSVSTNTIDALCKLLNCGLTDVLAFLPDENTP